MDLCASQHRGVLLLALLLQLRHGDLCIDIVCLEPKCLQSLRAHRQDTSQGQRCLMGKHGHQASRTHPRKHMGRADQQAQIHDPCAMHAAWTCVCAGQPQALLR